VRPIREIFFANGYAVTITGSDRVDRKNGVITNVYHVLDLSKNMLYVPQLTHIGKNVEFSSNKFVVKDSNNNFEVCVEGMLDHKDKLYKFCDFKCTNKKKKEIVFTYRHH
jgi:hypothetical protein